MRNEGVLYRIVIFNLILTLCSVQIFAKPDDDNTEDKSEISFYSEYEYSAQLAMSEADYMVTAGDVYQLSFAANGNPLTFTITVDSSYKIRVASFGIVNAAGKTYSTLKKQVEDLVIKNYPLGGVQFVLLKPSVFYVIVTGEVSETTEVRAWGLSRLSGVLEGMLTQYSSTRKIMVNSADGKIKTYDLFQASRSGKMEQNPYIRPGDKITVGRMERKVTVRGEVERPGTYELLAGENLSKLISFYANGLCDEADTERITLERNFGGDEKSGNLLYISKKEIDADFILNNGDTVTISTLQDLRPKVLVEGIISSEQESGENSDSQKAVPADTSFRLSVSFYSGENYATFVRRIQNLFTKYSDLENAYIKRGENKLLIDIRQLLDSPGLMSEYTVEDRDCLEIPFRQFFSKIMLTGEVEAVKEIEAWPLRRLSEVISGNLTPYSSTRKITVTSLDGKTQEYDLFQASRFGNMEQNPYILSGETVTVSRMERKVTVRGEVERPGTYELLEGESINQLIYYYGNGVTEFADFSRTEILRMINEDEKTGRTLYIGEDEIKENYQLLMYDTVTIPSYKDLRFAIFLEGAVNSSDNEALEASNRVEIRITKGTNYSTIVRENKNLFGATSDLQNAYIIRGDKHIPINLFELLYDATNYSELFVEPYDILRIPFRQYFVSVSGAVQNPGRYPYIPDRTYDYYVGLAGGFIRSQNIGEAVEITDINGKRMSKKDIITPECNINAKVNAFGYYFNQYAPVATTVLSIVSSLLSIIVVVSK